MAKIFSNAKGVYSSLRAFSMVAATAATIISALASFERRKRRLRRSRRTASISWSRRRPLI